jgi:hypothetical protein
MGGFDAKIDGKGSDATIKMNSWRQDQDWNGGQWGYSF